MGNICMLVGNGFTIDFSEKVGLNPSQPLSKFENEGISYSHFLPKLPAIREELFPLAKGEKNDYLAIEKFMGSPSYNWDKDCQLRRFLSLSYATLQLQLEHHNISQWHWTKWFREHRDELGMFVSFNYDLLLEKSLKVAGVRYYRTGSDEEPVGVPIVKPHGSIDFDIDSDHRSSERWEYTTALLDEGKVETVPKQEWLEPRFEADIIPPHKENYQRSLRWVKEGIATFKEAAGEFDTFIIVGHSYNEADRQEIDQYLENLHPGTRIEIVDPEPNKLLVAKINALGLELHRAGDQ
ncbi:hypothetical protein J2S74_004042 [Evansella vedderi]|uniref:SIR2-like domain-containing protein n=1 Tax=Evansella vedderi TaxID=38282 RepID=A0ABT9ZZE9_9BACI|nr:hypothetical protein [Evansella vedderi]MDQ0256620.1 hypothetical protein [Evansella vedderi]